MNRLIVKTKQFLSYLAIAVFLSGLMLTTIQAKAPTSNAQAEDVILQWNRVLSQSVATPGVHPSATIFPVRSSAMMHAAMFDAVNSIDGSYTPYLTDVPGSKNASAEAAAAKAAHDVLSALYPSLQAVYDAELANSLNGIEENRIRQGFRVGEIVAARMLEARANDGWAAPLPPYSLPPTPGNWQLAPGNIAVAFTHTPGVRTFAVINSSQFAPPPPPPMPSGQYAADFNEVKEIGSATSLTRTADQTLVARLWAVIVTTTSPFTSWNNVARNLSISRNLTLIEKARLFALFNIAVHDTLVTTFTSKFQYGLWRPVTAIRRADEDGNPNTIQDPAWSTLIPTPPYPAYAGNMAGIGTSHSTSLALFFGRDDIAFENTWAGSPGWTRSYASFSAMADEEANSRIYGGIHFRFDNVAGQAAGRNIANYVFSNFLTPRRK